MPALKGRIALVGYTAAGLNDAKPTPVDPVMAGVEVLAEATEALVAGSAIRVPPAWLKYVLAALLSVVTAYAFFRGEPHNDIDSIFVATNLALLAASFIGLSFFSYFFDVFAAVGFISLVLGLCRMYAKTRRGRAVGNGDYLPDFDPARDRFLAAWTARVLDAQLAALTPRLARPHDFWCQAEQSARAEVRQREQWMADAELIVGPHPPARRRGRRQDQ
jgi:hypothetical protein